MQQSNDKTFSIAELKKEYPNINWHSKAVITLRNIARAFRLYIKEMPEQGPCLSAEIISSFRDSKTLSEKIKEIVKGDDDAD